MKKRIFVSLLVMSLLTVIPLTLLVRLSVDASVRNLTLDALQAEAQLTTSRAATAGEALPLLENNLTLSRVTLIAPDGQVLFDTMKEPNSFDNHADREEFIGARSQGSASAIRRSGSSGMDTMYYAQKLQDGSVLRLSAPLRLVHSVFAGMLPGLLGGMAAIVCVAVLLSRIIAGMLLKPLSNIDLDEPEAANTYEELTPLLSRIMEQNKRSRQQIARLNAKQQEMDMLLNGMSEGFLAMDARHRLLSVNKSALQMLGVSAQDAQGRTLTAINRHPDMLNLLEELERTGTASATLRQGGRIYLLSASKVDGGSGSVMLIRDITEKTEGELMRKRFSANVSHELRTPLTTIFGYSDMLASGMVKPEDRQDFLERITAESRRMLDLVEDILRLSKLDEGYQGGRREKVDVLDCAKQTAVSLEAAAEFKQVHLTVTGESSLYVLGDPTLMGELIYNLADNAIKYNKPGGEAEISVHRSGDRVNLVVRDTGIGIHPTQQDKIFERFYRTDKSRSKETGGTGLGLSIVKHSAEYHSATLSVQSTPGQGSVFTVSFPIYIE
jgi:two-component system phosphate regulon sensor histidine kinase PhoR